ncbi:MAG: hypothetical protein ACREP6_15505 [Candidatus Binataceae bacterium]
MTKTRASCAAVFLMAAIVLVALISGCGVKSAPIAPQLVLPERIIDLHAMDIHHAVQLTWGRPEHYTGGKRMRDLADFAIMRAVDQQPFKPLVEIPITDQQRFQQATHLAYDDTAVEKGETYRYEIISRTSDGYQSAPSNVVTIVYGHKRGALQQSFQGLMPSSPNQGAAP